MPQRIRLPDKPTLTRLCHDLQAVADHKHQANELRSNGRTLHIKLRSACCLCSRESARHDHRQRAVALVGAGLAAELGELGASALKDHLLRQFLPDAGARRPAPVRLRDVLALAQVLERARKLATSLPGLLAVKLAAASVLYARHAGAPVDHPDSSPEPTLLPLEQRAAEYLAQALRIAQRHGRPPASPDSRLVLPDAFLRLAASFPVDELISPAELQRLERFLALARPLLARVAPVWRSMEVHELMKVVEQLAHMHRATYGYEVVEVHFDSRLTEVATLSADGVHVTLPTGQTDAVDQFDVFIHHLAYGLTLRYQHHLAASEATAATSDRALARLLRATQWVPMDRPSLGRQGGMSRPAARAAWLSSASHRHATALADLIAAPAFAALPNDESRLPRMARLGRNR